MYNCFGGQDNTNQLHGRDSYEVMLTISQRLISEDWSKRGRIGIGDKQKSGSIDSLNITPVSRQMDSMNWIFTLSGKRAM